MGLPTYFEVEIVPELNMVKIWSFKFNYGDFGDKYYLKYDVKNNDDYNELYKFCRDIALKIGELHDLNLEE